MNKNNFAAFSAAALLGLASAQTAVPAKALKQVLSRSLVETTVDKAGNKTETLKPIEKGVLPGQILDDTTTNSNTGKLPISAITIDMRVPNVYLSSTASRGDVKVLYSVDKGKTYGTAPLKKTITVQENGKSITKQVEALPSDYTNVRFVVPSLKAGESLKTSVRYRIS